MIPKGGCASFPSHPTLVPGLDYLYVMTLWDHNIFLGEQVLDAVLRDDVLYLKGGKEAVARAPPTRSAGWQSSRGFWDTQHLQYPRRGGLESIVPHKSGELKSSAAAHLVVRGHQMLYCLAVCCGDLLNVGGFLLPGPSQL